MASTIKVDFQNRLYIAQKAIAAGFQGIMFSDHENVEQVKESIDATTPYTLADKGHFGYPTRRFIGGQSNLPPMQHATRIRDVVRCFMIEKASALEQIDEICALPGVDMVQFGSGDWSMSLEFNRTDDPTRCNAAQKVMIGADLRHGVRPRIEIQKPEDAVPFLALGVKDFCLNDDLICLRRFWNETGKQLKTIVKA